MEFPDPPLALGLGLVPGQQLAPPGLTGKAKAYRHWWTL